MLPGTADNAAAHIRSLNESWLAAATRRDLAGMMAVYSPDAQELLPDMLPLVGRDSIRAFYQSLIERLPRFAHHFGAGGDYGGEFRRSRRRAWLVPVHA